MIRQKLRAWILTITMGFLAVTLLLATPPKTMVGGARNSVHGGVHTWNSLFTFWRAAETGPKPRKTP